MVEWVRAAVGSTLVGFCEACDLTAQEIETGEAVWSLGD